VALRQQDVEAALEVLARLVPEWQSSAPTAR
jgi:hypothetical protein